MNDEEHEPKKDRKPFILALFGLVGFVIALMALSFASSFAYQPIVNNTNLAPTIDPSTPGTGERVADGTVYWANDSARQVYWFIMNNETGSGSIDIDLSINGFRIQDDDIVMSAKTAGNRSKWLDIPFGANYSANITGTNVHHYTWIEYKKKFVKVT